MCFDCRTVITGPPLTVAADGRYGIGVPAAGVTDWAEDELTASTGVRPNTATISPAEPMAIRCDLVIFKLRPSVVV